MVSQSSHKRREKCLLNMSQSDRNICISWFSLSILSFICMYQHFRYIKTSEYNKKYKRTQSNDLSYFHWDKMKMIREMRWKSMFSCWMDRVLKTLFAFLMVGLIHLQLTQVCTAATPSLNGYTKSWYTALRTLKFLSFQYSYLPTITFTRIVVGDDAYYCY